MTEARSTPHAPSRTTDEVSLYAFGRVGLQYRYAIVGTGLVTAFVVAVAALLASRSFTAEATFMPQGMTGRGAGGLAALAGQLGMSLAEAEPTQSPQFYVELLASRELRSRLLADTFEVAADPRTGLVGERGTLADLLNIEEDSAPVRRERALRAVEGIVTATTAGMGLVRLEVKTGRADLSEAVAGRLIELVNQFNLETRQTNAAAERKFVEGRLSETGASLLEAEEALRQFLESNRQFQNSPQLLFEYDRLQRQVTHQQLVYTDLQQSLESARIVQVRDTPLITIVQPPEAPFHPDSRGVLRRFLLGLLFGGMAGFMFGFFREFVGRGSDRADPEYHRFQEAWSETVADLRAVRRLPSGFPSGSRK
jgi:uncharacterized protein involved in exopolysaccharide biosynthesis